MLNRLFPRDVPSRLLSWGIFAAVALHFALLVWLKLDAR